MQPAALYASCLLHPSIGDSVWRRVRDGVSRTVFFLIMVRGGGEHLGQGG